ncbi:hypothetical protein NDU88_005905 [Pleurodeles waltl]|uniref:Uncharacterized protein n=1 Tax=Pleurodeles waltl TaxID=8319 RepID=A0AAV7TBS8_PLEWA|nr:hypothetical protein NDU88_005905 [Pleurodeles waltl]
MQADQRWSPEGWIDEKPSSPCCEGEAHGRLRRADMLNCCGEAPQRLCRSLSSASQLPTYSQNCAANRFSYVPEAF